MEQDTQELLELLEETLEEYVGGGGSATEESVSSSSSSVTEESVSSSSSSSSAIEESVSSSSSSSSRRSRPTRRDFLLERYDCKPQFREDVDYCLRQWNIFVQYVVCAGYAWSWRVTPIPPKLPDKWASRKTSNEFKKWLGSDIAVDFALESKTTPADIPADIPTQKRARGSRKYVQYADTWQTKTFKEHFTTLKSFCHSGYQTALDKLDVRMNRSVWFKLVKERTMIFNLVVFWFNVCGYYLTPISLVQTAFTNHIKLLSQLRKPKDLAVALIEASFMGRNDDGTQSVDTVRYDIAQQDSFLRHSLFQFMLTHHIVLQADGKQYVDIPLLLERMVCAPGHTAVVRVSENGPVLESKFNATLSTWAGFHNVTLVSDLPPDLPGVRSPCVYGLLDQLHTLLDYLSANISTEHLSEVVPLWRARNYRTTLGMQGLDLDVVAVQTYDIIEGMKAFARGDQRWLQQDCLLGGGEDTSEERFNKAVKMVMYYSDL